MARQINLLIALYRDSYFYRSYGPAVRDLQFLETLEKLDVVARITVLNRPVSIIEKIVFRKFVPRKIETEKISTIDSLSFDLTGPLWGRAWAEKIYPTALDSALKIHIDGNRINVFLDFLPIGHCSATALDGWHYWYDFIDNFTKHNRYTENEKKLVEKKYNFVSAYADTVTAVSDGCFSSGRRYDATHIEVLSNRVFSGSGPEVRNLENSDEQLDFGFVGFVTNKFDIGFIEELASRYTIGVYGKVLDRGVSKRLKGIANVSMFGRFSYNDLPLIFSKFKVGLIPYLQRFSHDESPLKLYEYMKYSKPCLTSTDYEITDDRYIINYRKSKYLDQDIERLMAISGDGSVSACIREELRLGYALKEVVSSILMRENSVKNGLGCHLKE